MSVVFFHIGGSLASPVYFDFAALDRITHFGYVGMFLFFVLSGFIIHQAHARDLGRPERVWRYVNKRVLRIFPLYLFLLGLVSAFSLASGIGAEGIPTDPWTIVRTILLLPQDPAVVGGSGAPIIIVAWSLQYEMVFYLVMGLFIANRWLGIAVVGGLLLAWIGLTLGGRDGLFPAYMEMKYFLFFAMGVAASMVSGAGLSRRGADVLRRGATLGFVAALIASVTVKMTTRGELSLIGMVPMQLALGALAAALILGLAVAERDGARPAGSTLRHAGDWSYAIYLLHFPVISGFAKAVDALDLAAFPSAILAGLGALAATLIGAALLHRFIERPAMAWARDSRAGRPKKAS